MFNAHHAHRFIAIASILGCFGALTGCVAADEGELDAFVQGEDNLAQGVSAVALSNPGFESDKTGWGSSFEISTSDRHGGSKSGKITSSSGRMEQTVAVTPHTTYDLAAWVLGKGKIGVKSGTTIIGSKSVSNSAWSQATLTFDSGDASSITIYGAYNGGTGRFDDFTLTSAGATTDPTDPTDPEEPTDPVDPSAAYPSDLLDLAKWHLTLPVDTSHAGSPDQIEQPELDTFKDDTHFHLSAAKDAVLFRAYTNGATTSGSGYPRSELRERTSNYDKAAWSSSSGRHVMYIDQAVTHLPAVKPHIVVGQIHDGGDDVIVFRLEGTKLFIDLNGQDGPVLTSNYQLGTRFNVKFDVSNNQVKCYYNGELKYTYNKSFSGAYFKAGAYVQSSCQGDKKVSGESCSAYGEVAIYDLKVETL